MSEFFMFGPGLTLDILLPGRRSAAWEIISPSQKKKARQENTKPSTYVGWRKQERTQQQHYTIFCTTLFVDNFTLCFVRTLQQCAVLC